MKPFSQKMTDQLLRWYLNQPELERWECHVEQTKRINVIMNDARKDGIKLEANGEVYVIFHDHSPTWFSNPFTQARRAELVR